MARTGRPQSENPLKYDVKVRLDEETYTKLNEACETSGNDRAGIIRDALRAQLGLDETPAREKKIPVKGRIKSSMPGKKPLTKDISAAKSADKAAAPKAKPAAPKAAKPAAAKAAEPKHAAPKPAAAQAEHAKAPAPAPKKNLDVWLM